MIGMVFGSNLEVIHSIHSYAVSCLDDLMDASIDSTSSNVNVVFMKLNFCFSDESFAQKNI